MNNNYVYARKYKKSWEDEAWAKGWLVKTPANTGTSHLLEAYCKICKIELRAHQADLKRHGKTYAHLEKMKQMNPIKQKLITTVFSVNHKEKVQDVKLAIHTSIRSMDHLCNILKLMGKGSSLEQLKMHRTKCAATIQNVISPYFQDRIISDIGDKPYSLIIDESTDISVFKYMCFCIKYYSNKEKRLITDYLGLSPVEETTAKALALNLKTFVEKLGLNLNNLVSIGTDGAANLCGRHHSIFTILKQDVQHLQLIRCVCHSLNNASNKAAEELPSHIEFMCRENVKKCTKFIQLSTTRWLSRYKCISVIIEQWLELKTYFETTDKNEKCCTSRLLFGMFKDDKNYLLLLIIRSILYELNNINIIFQKNELNVGKAYDNLCSTIMFIARKIFQPVFVQNDIDCILQNLDNSLAYRKNEECDFGIEYYQGLNQLKKNSSQDKIFVEDRAVKYMKSLCTQLCLRLPTSLNHFRKIKVFSAESCLTQLQEKCSELPFLQEFYKKNKLGLLENQWNKLKEVNWVENFGESINNINSFWSIVYNFKDAGDSCPFNDIASFVLTILTLPTSNAVVERAFSIMNTVKTKLRNRLSFNLLDALIRVRLYLYARNVCCDNYNIEDKMIKNITSRIVYGEGDKTISNENKETDFEEIFELVELACDNIPVLEIPDY